MNNGVCQSLLLNYSCQCVDDSYSGRHCEIVSNKVVVRQTVSKSFAYISVIAIVSVVIFIVTLDILKYIFGIDPVCKEFEKIKRKNKTKKKKPLIIIRHTYVNAPSIQSSEMAIATI